MSLRHGWRRDPPVVTKIQQIIVAPTVVEPKPQPVPSVQSTVLMSTIPPPQLEEMRVESKKKVSAIKSLRPPKSVAPKTKCFQRPSLSEQLATIGDNASKITTDIQQKHGLSTNEYNRPLLAVPSMLLLVGKLETKQPSPVHFMSDRVTYHFMHPYQRKEIWMEMFYRDMVDSSLDTVNRTFSFRILRDLREFGDDYNYENYQHRICIGLGSGLDCEQVRSKILPIIKSNCHR
jgi:hypothetical protein